MSRLISFCCVCYNHAEFVERCVKSIWAQDLKNAEILVLDDGSKDNSVEILMELQKVSPYPMSVMTQENSGNIGANLNKLIQQTQGELIALISCDDEFIPNTFAEKIAFFDDEKLALVYESQMIFVDEDNEILSDFPKMSLDDIANPTYDDVLACDFQNIHSFYIQGAIFRKDIIDKIGGFDEDMICDDIILRTKYIRYLQANKYKMQILHKPGVLYRQHSNNIHKNHLRQVKGVIQYFARYWCNESPPQALHSWIESVLNQENISHKDKLEIFLNDSYIARILKHKNYLNLIDNDGYVFNSKIIGIPYILVLEKYKGGVLTGGGESEELSSYLISLSLAGQNNHNHLITNSLSSKSWEISYAF